MKPVLWQELAADKLRAMRDDGVDMVLLPIGGTLPHGPNLPVGCDSLLIEMLCHAISARTAVPVLPTVSVGVSQRAEALSFSPITLTNIVVDILESVYLFGMRRAVILSGNTENMPAIECALQTLRARHPEFLVVAKAFWEVTPLINDAWNKDVSTPHAGLAETALLQYLAPHLVGPAILPANTTSKETIFPDYSDDYRGAPADATAELGAELFEALAAGWTRFVKRALIEKKSEIEVTESGPRTEEPTFDGAALFRAPGSE